MKHLMLSPTILLISTMALAGIANPKRVSNKRHSDFYAQMQQIDNLTINKYRVADNVLPASPIDENNKKPRPK